MKFHVDWIMNIINVNNITDTVKCLFKARREVLTYIAFAVLLALNATPQANATQRKAMLGSNVEVGLFRVKANPKNGRVVVTDKSRHAALPSTELIAQFIQSDQANSTVTISIAIHNIGTKTLFGPLQAVLLGHLKEEDDDIDDHDDSDAADDRAKGIVALNADEGTGPGSWTWLYNGANLGSASQLSALATSKTREWKFFVPKRAPFHFDVLLAAGVPLSPGVGGTIEKPDGTSITIQPNSVPYEALVDINSIPVSSITAPLGMSQAVAAFNVTFEPSFPSGIAVPPNAPFQISVSAPATLPSSSFIVAQEELIDSIAGSPARLAEQLVPIDTASFGGGKLLTHADVFPGIFGEGLYVMIADTGSGFVSGTVSDASGPRVGAIISNSTNTLVAITNSAGQFKLFIDGGPFTLTAFDPFRGSSGTTTGAINTSGSTVTANLFLTTLAAPPVTRDGIRNSGFERGDLTSWSTTGAALAERQFGPTSTGVVIRPTEGEWMADINTGNGSVGGVGSSLKQQFIVPAGVKTLHLNFDFVSEEFPEFVGSIFNDAFHAIIRKPDGTCAIPTSTGDCAFAQVSVNESGGFILIGDCFFPGGDNTCGHTGWREASVDVSAFAGTTTPIELELLFSANDAGDNIFDTHVLIDNIRFSTLWIDPKAIAGAAADSARIKQEVRDANEILSQAGINVRLRNFQMISDPGGLLDTDITWTTACRPFLLCLIGAGTTKGVPTAEELQLLGLNRSAIDTDVNIYYVRSMPPGGAAALAIGPDDFHDITILGNAGAVIQDVGGCAPGGHVLAHELGHLLISPQSAGDVLEHAAGSTNFLGGNCVQPLLGILNRQQSNNINRTGAPLLTH